MIRVTVLVLSIALADSLNPGTLGPAFYLATAERPLRRVASFAAGFFAVNLAGGAVLVLGPGQLILSALPHPDRTAGFIVELAAGAVLLAVGGALIVLRHGAQSSSLPQISPRGKAAGAIGATIAAAELPTALPYFAAITTIVGSGLGLGSQLALVAAFNVVFISPVLAVLAGLALAGDRAERHLRRAGDWFRARWRQAFATLALVAGVLLVAFGASGLAGLR